MLSGIASYLFGTDNANDYNQTEEQPKCRLRTRYGEDTDEWLIVDPSSRGTSMERMETGPLENLLIEHPSMSVYGARGRPSSAGADSDTSEGETPMQQRQVMRKSPRRARAVAARAGILSKSATARSMQRAQAKENKHKHCKKALNRSNKLVSFRSTQPSARNRAQIRQPASKSGNKRC